MFLFAFNSFAIEKKAELAVPCLTRLGVIGELEQVISTEEVFIGKNDPGFWEVAAEKMGLAPAESALFDDAAASLQAAKAAGIYTVGVLDRFGSGFPGCADAVTWLDDQDLEVVQ